MRTHLRFRLRCGAVAVAKLCGAVAVPCAATAVRCRYTALRCGAGAVQNLPCAAVAVPKSRTAQGSNRHTNEKS